MDKYIGQMLDNRYEILEIMGIGGMAYVYKARCHLLNRYVAVKILKEEYARDADFRRRFHAESQAVAMLSHPNIMAVYDVSRTKELEYIVMELIDGITLKQYMQRKGLLSWREGLHFAIQIVKALSHAHSRGIIHRDIKPHNIMILRDGSVKVADFGIARFASKQNTLTQEALGSVHYISPEQARGSHIDARSDIYSVGVVLYEMLTERLPFEGDSPVSVALQHISSLPLSPREVNPDIPQALEIIIIKAMAPKLTRRYASADDMLRDLEEFRKNPSISFEYDPDELKTPADDQAEEPTRSLPGGAKGKGLKLDAKTEAEERRRIRREMLEEENHKTRKSGNFIATLSAILGVLVLIAVLGYVVIVMVGGLFNQPVSEQVDVPDFRGRIYTDALPDEYPRLRFVIVRDYSERPKDTIVDQDPLPRLAPEGTEVLLTVSLGREPVALIDMTGMGLSEAQAWLINNDLRYDGSANRREQHDTIPRDSVIRAETEDGRDARNANVYKGDLIILVISTGKNAQTTTMPSVINLDEEEAGRTLRYYNLQVGTVTVVPSDVEAGKVVWQSVPAGDTVYENDSIDLEISEGPVIIDQPSPSDPAVSPSDPDASPSPPPVEPSPSPAAEPVSLRQPVRPPADTVGMTLLTVEKNGVKIYEESVNAEEQPFYIDITGYPDDVITVFFDGALTYSRSIAAIQQNQ
ncbi:MAG: Stk1 family PASTA domain-containing Ser/Thr kinase [Oscillospiraceae bacterium]|jgi:serine/threonine-protein kinase|nr:Stk1 family PASTA domain-containing Ser/Thr kinase [Oscillospiraceae bacterium]